MKRLTTIYLLTACAALCLGNAARADGARDLLRERIQSRGGLQDLDTYRAHNKPSETVSYGSDPNQRFDVYARGQGKDAPVIFMVHGGGWKRGDKGASGVVDNKVERWGTRGIVFISTNYRMLPDANPYSQAEDVARALAKAQAEAARWGADPKRFVLMGHSAGAHLVALLACSPDLLKKYGAVAPLATVSLDSAALNVVETMNRRHFDLYDEAFGTSRDFWIKASPWHALNTKPAPILMVCSTRRLDSCPQSQALASKIKSYGGIGEVLGEDLTHAEINKRLGEATAYTDAVEDFLRRQDPSLAKLLR